jgi:hypothetical protein
LLAKKDLGRIQQHIEKEKEKERKKEREREREREICNFAIRSLNEFGD